jgi:hypothetical protein
MGSGDASVAGSSFFLLKGLCASLRTSVGLIGPHTHIAFH